MSNKLISEMGLPASIANVFAARNVLTAKAINTSAFLSSFTGNPSSFIRFLSPGTFRVSHAATVALFLFLRMLSRCRSSISWPFWAWISISRRLIFAIESSVKFAMAGRIVVLRPSSLSEFTERRCYLYLKSSLQLATDKADDSPA
ncbi:hypothetical protein BHE74_00024071 [Ensete ventricosum]|nr:hypothetical protein BHE74_00024071 [Ensete ventricosum]RZR93669.1 hypothetical protein BHM03_00022224 [Ensete ventricosum]